ncbi:MAG: response regulator [Candidatus Omnitrophica bacterium]|jgi:CheY-like chemotaxis protein|nr:response regulator [Candidatus Omnitrophota bacterium]
MRILIVDDESDTREIMLCIFRKKGLIAEAAKNGIEAIAAIAQNKPDIIIFNITLAEMDGFVTGKLLRENPQTRDIPIIFLTSEKNLGRLICQLPGAKVKYVEKPCNIRYLIKECSKLIVDSLPHQPR